MNIRKHRRQQGLRRALEIPPNPAKMPDLKPQTAPMIAMTTTTTKTTTTKGK
jgi:hypothetical protein